MVFNRAMTDAELITLHGGSTAVAKRLGLDGLNGARRVNNWKRRGIPALIKLENPWLRQSVKRQAQVATDDATTSEAADA